jgi:hypothetical protein
MLGSQIMKTSKTKGYTSEVRMHTGGGRSFYSWTVQDPVGNRVKFGNTRSRAEAVLEAEKAIWRLQQAKPANKSSARL